MITYRLQALDEQGSEVTGTPVDIGMLDGVIVLQVDSDLVMTERELKHLDAQLTAAFPGRKHLILTGGIRFVRFVPVDQG